MPSSTPWFLRARLKTRQLLLLTAIGDEGNIYRAAETINISQPAASKLLKDLEKTLGVTLFERLPRGMRPTAYGETLIRHARIALSSLREAGSQIEALKSGRFGEVRLGTITGPAVSLLPQALAGIAREYPSLRIEITVESSDVLLERLSQAKLDIMIGRLLEGHDKTNLAYEPLAKEPICAIVRPGHALLNIRKVTLKHLAQTPWIVQPPGSILRHRFELMFQEAGLSIPRQLIETSSLLFVTRMLQQSDFAAVVPTDVARYYASYGMVTMLPIALSCTMDAYGLITRKDWLLSPAAQVVLKALKAAPDIHDSL